MRAVEHIIPQHIGNRSFAHRDACRRMNHGLAHAVEAIFHRHSAINTILAFLSSPRRQQPHFLWKMEQGTKEERFVFLQNGRVVHGTPPEYTTFNTVQIPLLRSDGTQVFCQIQLPFELVSKVTGSELLLPKRVVQKRLDDNMQQLTEYLQQLFQNPELDPSFAKFIVDNDVVPSELYFNIRLNESPAAADDDTQLLQREHLVDVTVAARYFIKIAVLFAAESCNVALLATPQADVLRSYLGAFFVEPTLARDVDGSLLPFFAEASVADAPAYWWAAPIDATEIAINTASCLTSDQREMLTIENELRAQRLWTIRHLVRFEKLGAIPDEDLRQRLPELAYHELAIRPDTDGALSPGIWCDVRLFGGIFHVMVQLSADESTLASSAQRRIETPWYRRAS
jgi:hypothetical protein